MDGWMFHLVVIEMFGGCQLYPELRPNPEDRQHNTDNGHKERQLDLETGGKCEIFNKTHNHTTLVYNCIKIHPSTRHHITAPPGDMND